MTFEMYVHEREMKGRAETLFEMVKNFLLAKTPIEYIKAATGWSEEKILQVTKTLDDSNK